MGSVWINIMNSFHTGFLKIILLVIPLLFISVLVYNISMTPIKVMSSESVVYSLTAKIFGIDNNTNNIAVVFMINNQSQIRIQNASYLDLTDQYPGDGIIFTARRFIDVDPSSIDTIRACVLILKDIKMICQTGDINPSINSEKVNIFLNATEKYHTTRYNLSPD